MSNNSVQVPVVRVLDPETDVNNKRVYAISSGGSDVSYQFFSTNSFNSSSAQIQTNPPSSNLLTSRKVIQTMQ